MNCKRMGLVAALIGTTACLGAAPAKQSGNLTVHEWGTFLAMSGSDGVTLDGMYHEEHALPSFVHARSKDQLRLHSAIVKGETPVIYFYTDRAQKVDLKVSFPGGIWTQWYPQAALVGPGLAQTGSPPQLKNGHISWHVNVTPADRNPVAKPPSTARDALWNFARDVDAAYVQSREGSGLSQASECDRFIFYRGLGHAALPLQMSAANGGTLSCAVPVLHAVPSDRDPSRTSSNGISGDGSMPTAVKNLFVIRVEKGRGTYRYYPDLSPGSTETGVLPSMAESLPLESFAKKIGEDLANRLVEAGLYPKEARAMVNTWSNSYFKTDGVRTLFVLPQKWTDSFIPMEIESGPADIVRVMVGRVELLTPERERKIEQSVRDLSSANPATRRAAFDLLREQGRYVEPILRRIVSSSQEPEVRKLGKQLLLTGFVNELRTSLLSASNGGKTVHRPYDVRAQLACTLREAGLATEAKAEGEAVLAELHKASEPKMTDHLARFYLRSSARAMEGIGDQRGALETYGRFVEFGSAAGKCGNDFCHAVDGPRNASFFRDWWAGRKFAQYAKQTGQTEKLIQANRATLDSKKDDRVAQLKLAYLYEASGQLDQAAELWARIDPTSRKNAAVARSGQR